MPGKALEKRVGMLARGTGAQVADHDQSAEHACEIPTCPVQRATMSLAAEYGKASRRPCETKRPFAKDRLSHRSKCVSRNQLQNHES